MPCKIDQASSVEIAGYWLRSLLLSLPVWRSDEIGHSKQNDRGPCICLLQEVGKYIDRRLAQWRS